MPLTGPNLGSGSVIGLVELGSLPVMINDMSARVCSKSAINAF